MQIVVLNRLRHLIRGQFAAQLRETRGELSEPADLICVERQVACQKVVVARRPRRAPQVRHPVREVLVHVGGLAALELGI